jgi:hypothetical protein
LLALAMGVKATLFRFLEEHIPPPPAVPDAGPVVWIHRDHNLVCNFAEHLEIPGDWRSIEPTAWFRFGAYADPDGVNRALSIEPVSANCAEVCGRAFSLGTQMAGGVGGRSRTAGGIALGAQPDAMQRLVLPRNYLYGLIRSILWPSDVRAYFGRGSRL